MGHDTIYLREKKCFKITLDQCYCAMIRVTYLGAEKSLLDRLQKQLQEVRSSSAFLVLYKALSGTISIATFCGIH